MPQTQSFKHSTDVEIINEILHYILNTKSLKPRVYFTSQFRPSQYEVLTSLMLVATVLNSTPKTNQQQRPSNELLPSTLVPATLEAKVGSPELKYSSSFQATPRAPIWKRNQIKSEKLVSILIQQV